MSQMLARPIIADCFATAATSFAKNGVLKGLTSCCSIRLVLVRLDLHAKGERLVLRCLQNWLMSRNNLSSCLVVNLRGGLWNCQNLLQVPRGTRMGMDIDNQ